MEYYTQPLPLSHCQANHSLLETFVDTSPSNLWNVKGVVDILPFFRVKYQDSLGISVNKSSY